MSIKQARNATIKNLTRYLGIPIVLSDQVKEETAVPYGVYSVLTHGNTQGTGNRKRQITDNGQDVELVRAEQPTATLSFTFCSENREGPDGPIYGEDETIELAEKAIGWFRHVGIHQLRLAGVVVVEVQNAAPRSVFVVAEQSRRWGFDVTIRYARADVRNDSAVDYTTIIQRRD
ncbi:MAG: hypothetical protein LBB75_06515 [Oscillospiraceae bacterium]|jgi:hypothetical protein|nr:hypothetical protein [Oscillospiraceae bacterium]